MSYEKVLNMNKENLQNVNTIKIIIFWYINLLYTGCLFFCVNKI